MASVQKFTNEAMDKMLRHNDRAIGNSANTDIDPCKSSLNYSFPLNHGPLSDYAYYQKLLDTSYLYGRGSTREKRSITGCGWIVTLPRELFGQAEQEKAFFRGVFDFVFDRYGSENIINNAVHYDEAGLPHIHIVFCPITVLDHDVVHYKTQKTTQVKKLDSGRYEFQYHFKLDENGEKIPLKNYAKMSDYYDSKIDCNSVLNKVELKNFHPDLQKYLQENGIAGSVITGKTGGVNFTVKELKNFTEKTGLHLNDIKDMQKDKSILESYSDQNKKIQELEHILLEKDIKLESLQNEYGIKNQELTSANQRTQFLEKKISEIEQSLNEKLEEIATAKQRIQELEKEKSVFLSHTDHNHAEWGNSSSGWGDQAHSGWGNVIADEEKSWSK